MDQSTTTTRQQNPRPSLTPRAPSVTGTLALDTSGRIVFYNQAEGLLSPRRSQELLGKNLFTDFSPYQHAPGLYKLFQDGVAKRSLCRRFSLLAPNGTRLRLSLLYSVANNLVWARIDVLP